jgi:hypothetical protein
MISPNGRDYTVRIMFNLNDNVVPAPELANLQMKR